VRVLVLHDLSQDEARYGVRRRLQHLRCHEESAGNTVEIRSIIPPGRRRPGRPERLLRTCAAAGRFRADDFDKVVVVALSAPHMVFLARALVRRRSVSVQLDVCDSRRLLAAQRRTTTGRPARMRAATSELVARVAFARLPPAVTRSYISRHDVDSDAGLSGSATLVVGPADFPDLAELGPFVGRPRSILCPVDTTTVEGRASITLLGEVMGEAAITVPVEVSGEPPADDPQAAPGLRWLGYVPTLHELYARPCVVVSTNPASHGVQNKLWEAFQARRPVVAFDYALHWAPRVPWIHRVPSREEFGRILRAALETDHDTGAGVPEPEPEPGSRA